MRPAMPGRLRRAGVKPARLGRARGRRGRPPLRSTGRPATVTDVDTAGRTRMTFLGHATFRLSTPEGREVVIDPWTYRNPLCPPALRDVGPVDLALITHAHHDHLGDLFTIARDTRPRIVAVAELGHWMLRRGLHRVQTMNPGGGA